MAARGIVKTLYELVACEVRALPCPMTLEILRSGNRFQVVRPNTGTVTAKMVNVYPPADRYRAVSKPVR